MELLINLSESYHTLIGIFAQRNPLKNWPMSFFYSMAVILISYSFSIFGFPTYVSQLVIFVILLTGALIEPSNDKTNAMVKATIFATLPYINLKLDGFIQDFFLSNIQIESIETELIVSHIISLILIILLTRLEMSFYKYCQNQFNQLSFWIIPIQLSLYFFFIYSDLALTITEMYDASPAQTLLHFSPFVVLPILSILSIVFFNHAMNQSQEVAREKEQFKVSQAFSSMMADQYQEMRKFRHDYKNILLTLEGYIRDQEWQGLADYFHQHIQPTQVTTDQLGQELSRLSKIQSPDVRNLLFTKLAFAGTNGIDLSIEVPDDIHLNVARNPIYLVRIIGILLDNAIEALSNQEGGKLALAVFEDQGQVHLIIENDCQEDPGDLNKLLEAGYSSKGSGRGLGLPNAMELARQSHFQLLTQFANGRFSQDLIIGKELLAP